MKLVDSATAFEGQSPMATATATRSLRNRRGAAMTAAGAAVAMSKAATAVPGAAAEAAALAAARRADAVVTAPVAVVVSVGLIDPVVVAAAIAVAHIAVGSDGAGSKTDDDCGAEREAGSRQARSRGAVAATVSEEPASAIHFGAVCESAAVHSMTPKGAP